MSLLALASDLDSQREGEDAVRTFMPTDSVEASAGGRPA
jgi:hypothetical protein